MPLALSPEDFETCRKLIRERSGIWLGDSKVSFLQIRIGERLKARNITTPRDYYRFIKYDPAGEEELQKLVDAVTINETWFFRELPPLQAWCQLVAPEILKRSGRLRAWSAGCSSGEEPYTLAMLLLASFPTATLQMEITATDISQRALEVARAGIYDAYSLRHTEAQWLKHFTPQTTPSANGATPHARQTINGEVRKLVQFGWANLFDTTLAGRIGQVDVVICRNVLIYFDDQSRRVVLNNFHTALRPEGYLILGSSDTLAHTTSLFDLIRLGEAMVYRKAI